MKSKWTFSFLHFFTLNQKHEEVKSKEEITVRKKKFVPLNFLLIRLNLAFKESNGIIAYNFRNNFFVNVLNVHSIRFNYQLIHLFLFDFIIHYRISTWWWTENQSVTITCQIGQAKWKSIWIFSKKTAERF